MQKNSLLLSFTLVLSLCLVYSWQSCESNPFKQGEILYGNFCANCHMEDGSGLEGLIPPLAQADWVQQNQDQLACIIRYGMEAEIVVNGKKYKEKMPGVPQLTDFEVTNVINYINSAWGNNYGYVKYETIKGQLEQCED